MRGNSPKTIKCPCCARSFLQKSKGIHGMTAFCSRTCANKANIHVAIKKLTCARCGNTFEAKDDHGKERKYCSRSCFCASASYSNCKFCGKEIRLRGSRSKFCSKDCLSKFSQDNRKRKCVNCGSEFLAQWAHGNYRCCSKKCQHAYFSGTKSNAWKGGEYLNTAKMETFVRVKSGCYVGKHRVVAASVLGHPLTTEYIIFLDRDHQNCDPSNLYIYATLGELSSDRNRGVRPIVSNLVPLTYRRPIRSEAVIHERSREDRNSV